jgi:3-oxoacyl-[acyl-carrier-protein] synthase-3
MRLDGVFVAGIGVADTGVVRVADAVSRGWWDAVSAEASGLVSVSVAGEVPAPVLAAEAARVAVAGSGLGAGDFAGVFHVSVHPQGPDGWSAQHFINRQVLGAGVPSVEVRNGCVGFFSALWLASCQLVASGGRAALVTCADNFGTPAVDRWRASRLFVLADGGGAVVLSRRGGFARVLAVGSVSDPELEERHRCGEKLFPPSLTTGAILNFEERTRRFQMKLADGTLTLARDPGSLLVETVERTLKEAGVSMGEITRVVHDGFNKDALEVMFLDPLQVEPERGIWEFCSRAGHAGPLDALRGLEYVWRDHRAGPGDKVLLVSDTPGMEAACAVLEILASPE